jgi:hypothetical protein
LHEALVDTEGVTVTVVTDPDAVAHSLELEPSGDVVPLARMIVVVLPTKGSVKMEFGVGSAFVTQDRTQCLIHTTSQDPRVVHCRSSKMAIGLPIVPPDLFKFEGQRDVKALQRMSRQLLLHTEALRGQDDEPATVLQ